jgi:hypothetical protein
MYRDLPLNKEQRKNGCIFYSIFLILLITTLIILFNAINN